MSLDVDVCTQIRLVLRLLKRAQNGLGMVKIKTNAFDLYDNLQVKTLGKSIYLVNVHFIFNHF